MSEARGKRRRRRGARRGGVIAGVTPLTQMLFSAPFFLSPLSPPRAAFGYAFLRIPTRPGPGPVQGPTRPIQDSSVAPSS